MVFKVFYIFYIKNAINYLFDQFGILVHQSKFLYFKKRSQET